MRSASPIRQLVGTRLNASAGPKSLLTSLTRRSAVSIFCPVPTAPRAPSPRRRHRVLDELQGESFSYFLHETNRRNGLVRDKTAKGSPASIAAVGMALSGYAVGVERGLLTRAEAVRRTLVALRFFWRS